MTLSRRSDHNPNTLRVENDYLCSQKVENSGEADMPGLPYGQWLAQGVLLVNGSAPRDPRRFRSGNGAPGYSVEGYGFSNDARALLGAPSFPVASLHHWQGLEPPIDLHY